MKKLHISSTPPRKSDNSVNKNFLSKFFYIFITATCLAVSPCHAVYADAPEQIEESIMQISSFCSYEWGTSYDEIKDAETTDDMQENIDYAEDTVGDCTCWGVFHKDIAGYDAQVGFVFFEDKLTAGTYVMDGEDKQIFDDLLDKFTSKYGEPYLNKESTGWGRIAVWVDNDNNVICTSEMLNTIYMESDSPFIEYYNDIFIKFHELDLQKELHKHNNTDGL